MVRTRIKICGITRIEDAQSAAYLGADAIGLVFCQSSPRVIDINKAKQIISGLPPFVSVVALFMNNSQSEVQAVLEHVRVTLLQFHGDETAEFCERFGFPYIKAVPMLENIDISAYIQPFSQAGAYLLDAVKLGQEGGRGQTFAWDDVPQSLEKPIIMAGGLNASNVAKAIQSSACYGVDVSSGVESDKGIKDKAKMKAFIEQVKLADYENNS